MLVLVLVLVLGTRAGGGAGARARFRLRSTRAPVPDHEDQHESRSRRRGRSRARPVAAEWRPKKKRARRTRRSTRRVFPFGGSSFACRCADQVAPACAPSREGSVLLGVLVCERLTGSLGSPSPAAPSTFPPGPAVSLRSPSTSGLRQRLHPPASFPPPPECYGLRPAHRVSKWSCDHSSTGERLPWGPLPHRGVNWRRPPPPRESRPRGHVPSAPFLTTSRVCSASSLRGFVSPRCHVQGLPFRGLSLSAEPYRLSPAESCPLAVGRIGLRFDPRQPLRPRLQGLAPRGECGAGRDGLGLDRSAPLLGFASSGSSPRATCGCFHTRSARDVPCDEPTAAGHRRLAVARIGLPGIRLPTRSRFPA